MKEDKLTEREKELFAGLEREEIPPAGLEKRIVDELRQKNLIRKKNTWPLIMKWSSGLAAGILLFAAGIFYEKLNTTTMTAFDPKNGYILILHEDGSFQPGDPMAMFNEYSAWMEGARESGVTITGQELKPDGMMVKSSRTHPVSAEERTTGYFIIEASSMDEAVTVARANPHIKYGGSIEVKPFMVR